MKLWLRVVLGALVPVLLLLLWVWAVRNRVVSPDALPHPRDVVDAFRVERDEDRYVPAVLHSLRVTVLGWLMAAVVGVGVGLAIGLSRAMTVMIGTSVEFLRAVPAVALVPVAILIFGFDVRAELMVVVFASIWPVLINTVAAVRLLPPQLDEASRTLELSPVERVVKVTLPAAMPRIFVGLRLAMATAVTLMAVAEMTGNPGGVGNELVLAQSSVRPETAMLYAVTVGILGLVLNAVMVGAVRLPGLRRIVGGPS